MWLSIVVIIVIGIIWIKPNKIVSFQKPSFKEQLNQATENQRKTPTPQLSASWINFLREIKTHWAIFEANQKRKKGYKKHQQKIADQQNNEFRWKGKPTISIQCCAKPDLVKVNQGRFCLACKTLHSYE